MNRLALVLMMMLAASGLGAQATLPVSGNVSDTDERMILIGVDFGASAQSLTLTVSIAATGGSSGLDAALFDLDLVAQSGTAVGSDSGFDSGTGNIALTLVTGTYTGVKEFILSVQTDSGSGTSPFSGSVNCASRAAGSITQLGVQVVPLTFNVVQTLYDRAARTNFNGVGTVQTREFDVDFGATAQAMTLCFIGVGSVTGSIEIFELSSTGTPTSLGTVSGTVTFWLDEGNFTTSVRNGVVRFRVTLTPSAIGQYQWTVVTPQFAALQAISGGGGGGGGDKGCSTSEATGPWLGLLAALALAAVALRVRRA